ncbi:MAG: HipA domain-containing protein [Spirochaetia bacterium]|jgi:serine/threonine-protein kinase HipA|nr:HipA domain-containing protein [Spirochaetia bacterium]
MKYDHCLCCGRPLELQNEYATGWHQGCIKKFFSTSSLPRLQLDDEGINRLAEETVQKGLTVTGIQKKLSLHLSSENIHKKDFRLTLIGYPAGFILKPQSKGYQQLPEAEHTVMLLADSIGIPTVPHALILMKDGTPAYITKRIDRKGKNKLQMEDFCQLSERLTEDKYKGSYEQCGKIIRKWSSMPGIDITGFFRLTLFNFITGNSDMHLKNFSLIENENHAFRLSKAYDLLPVQLVNPMDTEQTALTLNGKKNKIGRKDFIALGQNLGINDKAILNMMDELIEKASSFNPIIDSSYLQKPLKTSLKGLIQTRCTILKDMA